MVINTTPGDNDIYQMMAAYLAEVGIRTTLRTRLFSSWLKSYVNGDWDADAFSLAWIAAPFNDVYRPMDYYSCARFQPFFCDPALMDLLVQAGREMDPERRVRLLQQLAVDFHDASATALDSVALPDTVPALADYPQGATLTITRSTLGDPESEQERLMACQRLREGEMCRYGGEVGQCRLARRGLICTSLNAWPDSAIISARIDRVEDQ